MSDVKSTPTVTGNHWVLVRIGLVTAVVAAIAGFFGVLDEAFDKGIGALESGRDLIASVWPSEAPVVPQTPMTETTPDLPVASPNPSSQTSEATLRAQHDEVSKAMGNLSKTIDEVVK